MTDTGLREVKILLPNNVDMTAWSCVACDQFTGSKEYWQTLEQMVKNKPTTLDLILPEIYLDNNLDERIKKVNANISDYLEKGIFKELNKGFILTVRSTPFVERRLGLIGAIDLEKYEYKSGSNSTIRATEGTIEERIPPRLKIRENAEIEFPHIMILFDDEKREIIENLYDNRNEAEKLYDFDLNMGGGHVIGYYIPNGNHVLEAFSKLADKDRLLEKYGKVDNFIFAVGDGNHSLATAKAHWNKIKEGLNEQEKQTHPARFALCEICNIYDDGIYFEPIYRFVNGIEPKDFIKGLKKINGGRLRIYDGEESELFTDNSLPDGIREVDRYINEYISKKGGCVDYIHGEKNIKKMVDSDKTSVGILFEKLDKRELFRYISKKGVLPKKTFSMGEGVEKRYYLEGKKIK